MGKAVVDKPIVERQLVVTINDVLNSMKIQTVGKFTASDVLKIGRILRARNLEIANDLFKSKSSGL